MKSLILMMTLAVLLSAGSLALAGGSQDRFAIDQTWKSVEAWQQAQDQRLKEIETSLDGTSVTAQASPSLPPSGQAAFWPVTAAGASHKGSTPVLLPGGGGRFSR
jgi:hypothetical protein